MTPVVVHTHTHTHARTHAHTDTHLHRHRWRNIATLLEHRHFFSLRHPQCAAKRRFIKMYPFKFSIRSLLTFFTFPPCYYKLAECQLNWNMTGWAVVALGNLTRRSDLFTVDMRLIPPLGQLEGTQHRRFSNSTHQGPREGAVGFIMGVRRPQINSASYNWMAYLWAEQGLCAQKVGCGICLWTYTQVTKYCKVVLHNLVFCS